MKFYPKMLDKL